MNDVLQSELAAALETVRRSPAGELPMGRRAHLYTALGAEKWKPDYGFLFDFKTDPRSRWFERQHEKRYQPPWFPLPWYPLPGDVHTSPGATPSGHRRRVHLALSTARAVLPLWEQAFPEDLRPHYCLLAAEGVVEGRLSIPLAINFYLVMNPMGYVPSHANLIRLLEKSALALPESVLRNAGRTQLPGLPHVTGRDEEQRAVSINSVLEASRGALHVALYDERFDPDALPEPEWNDISALDTMEFDSVLYAATSYTFTPRFSPVDIIEEFSFGDPLLHREFWEWWLTEAVPHAYAAVPEP